MNLLTDSWVPVRDGNTLRHLSLKEVLCADGSWELGLNRDDLNLAALQLLICLTQVVLTPQNRDELRLREREPLSEAEYDSVIDRFLDWFDLQHPKHPFMQTRGVKATEPTPIQKLFPGLPEGNNHALFNQPDEVRSACESCCVIALFNQAVNVPGFGGGFKAGLRGAAPLTIFVKGPSVRRTIWRNVMSQDFISSIYSLEPTDEFPVWVDVLEKERIYPAAHIGIVRGLFWQPAHIELGDWRSGICQSCGLQIAKVVAGFNKEKFNYKVDGLWTHPHSPRTWKEKKGQLEVKYASFTTTAPTWTQLSFLVAENPDRKEGYARAPVMSQFETVFQPFLGETLQLIVGGYRNNQAAIIERRHELLSLSNGWEQNLAAIRRLVELASETKTILRGKTYFFGKQVGLEGLAQRAEERFFQSSESDVHQVLRKVKWNEVAVVREKFLAQLAKLARNIFEELTSPYQHEPKMLKALAVSRRSLEKDLTRLTGGDKK